MQTILIIHIVGAMASGGVVVWAWRNIFQNKSLYKVSNLLQGLTIFEVISGTVLAIMSDMSIANFCANIGVYTLIITGTLVALKYKSAKTFPWQPLIQNTALVLSAIAIMLISK